LNRSVPSDTSRPLDPSLRLNGAYSFLTGSRARISKCSIP
jgi:hypothetical protein